MLTYLALRKILAKQNKSENYVSLGLLIYTLFDNPIVNQLITNSFITGLKKLLNKAYITIVQKGRINEYVLDLSNFQIQVDKEYYSTVNSDYIKKIVCSDQKEKMQLLCFYCYIATTIMKSGDKEGAGFTSYEVMSNDIGVSRQTISNYMNKLEEMKIIHIYRSTDAICINGIIKEIPNVYGDIVNKDKIINIGKTFEQNYGSNAKRIKSMKTSATRSASAKYNVLINDLNTTGEIRYSYDELKEIYKTLKDYNDKYNLKEGDDKYKDLSIFQNYDFYK